MRKKVNKHDCKGFNELNILKSDPFLYFLHGYLKWSPRSIAFVFVFFSVIFLIFLAILTGAWDGIDYPLINSYTTWIGDIVLGIAVASILKYYKEIPIAFNSLLKNGVMKKHEAEYKAFLSHEIEKYNYNRIETKIILIVSFIVSLGLHISYLLDNLHGWTERNESISFSLLGIYHIFIFAIYLFILLNFSANLIKTTSTIRKLNQILVKHLSDVELVRLCPYECGGFYSFSKLAFGAFKVISALGIYIFLLSVTLYSVAIQHDTFFLWQRLEVLLTPVYFILAPSVLFLHIMPIHDFMKKFKYGLISELILLEKKTVCLSKKALKRIINDERKIGKLRAIEDLHSAVSKFPIWPLKSSSIKYLFEYILIGFMQVVLGIVALMMK